MQSWHTNEAGLDALETEAVREVGMTQHSLLLPRKTEELDSSGVQAFHWCCLARQKNVYLPADPQPADPPREALQFADDHQQVQMEAMAKALMANTAAISELKDVAHSWGGGTRMEGDGRRGERGQGSWASPAWFEMPFGLGWRGGGWGGLL